MAWTKAKTAIVVGVGVLLAAGTTTIAIKEIQKHQPCNRAVILEGTYSCEDKVSPVGFNGETSSLGVFHVLIQGNSWIINYQDFSALTNSRALSSAVDASCDGTNIYLVHTVNPALINEITKGTEIDTNTFLSHQAEIYTGVYPPAIETLTYNLWVAFASSGVLSNATGTTKPPIGADLSKFYNDNFECDYAWKTNVEGKYPRELVMKSSGRWFQRDRHNGKLDFLDLGPPYEKGFTMAMGRWLEATNIAGVFAPMEYEFSTFITKPHATNAADLILRTTFQCSVTNVQLVGIQPIPPGLAGQNTRVDDHRFAGRGYATATYFITNKWPKVDDSQLTNVLRATPKVSLEAEALKQLGFQPPAP